MVAMLMPLWRERRSGKTGDLGVFVCVCVCARDKFETFFSWRYFDPCILIAWGPAGLSCVIKNLEGYCTFVLLQAEIVRSVRLLR